MKKLLSYAGLLVLAGIIFGAIVTGLVWMQHLYDLSVSYYLFTAAFWLSMTATVLFGIWLRRYYQQISKAWVFFSVLTALFGAYLFPKFLTPRCSEIPTVKAGCETTCVTPCIRWVPLNGTLSDGTKCKKTDPWDEGCCDKYGPESCTTVCTNDPPSVTGHTECDVFGNDGWCVQGGELHMSGSDSEQAITISGTMVGQPFSCTQGNTCVKELYEGAGNAIFHAYDGELSSGNFSIAYKFDATPPVLTPAVTGTVGTNGWYISYVSVATGATDPASGVMMSKIRLFSGGWEDSLDFNADGIYNIEMSALDNAGNESVQQAQIMVDTVDPVYDVLVGGTPGINDWYRSDVNWQAAATDATSGMASIEVNMDAAGWMVANTASFSDEGPHTVDFRFTDVAGNNVSTSHAFSIDKTPPTITMNTPTEGKVVSRNVIVSGTVADALSGLMEVAVSPDGGYTWHIIPWQPDGSWQYDWDTTSGPNGVFALIARATDEAGNVTTDQVNVIVDNAPPTVSITESWDLWDMARGSVHSNVIPVGSIHLTVECGDQPDRTYDYNANTNTFDFKWDRRCGDGNLAPSGTYTVVLEACDIYNNCDEARGKVDIPFGTLQSLPLTATPMPTIENTEVVQQWYTNPTTVPSTTPTPQAQQSLPVLPVTANGESGDGNMPSGNNQPLLPLAAAALGTSVLLAASSRREEETANAPAAAETTYVEAASLSSIAGVVKETFTGVWEDAIRISAADPRRVTTTHTGIDMDEYNRKLAGWVIASEQAYKEIAKEKEEKRQAAIQWLADNKARTDEAARVAKEKEIAETIAAQKAAALDAKLARMEEQTAGRNVMAQTNAAKALYKSSIPEEPTPTPEGEGGFFPNLWNGFLSIFGLGSNNQATSTQTVVPPRTATPTPPPTKTNTPTITSTPTPVIPIGVQYEKEIHNDEINALKACYADIKNVFYGITPTPTLTATATIESTLEATATPTIEVTPTPIIKDADFFKKLYKWDDLYIYYTKKVVDGKTVYNCEYVGDTNLTADEIEDDYEQLNTYRKGNCANFVNTILKKTGLDLEGKYESNEIYENVRISAPAMAQALVVEEKWTIEAITKDNLVEKATTDKVGCVVAFSDENIVTTLFSENIVGTSTPSPTSTGTNTPEVTNTPTLIPDPKNSDSPFSQIRHVGYITDVSEGDIIYADNSSTDLYDQLEDENIQMNQLSNDYKSLNQRMTDKPEYSVYVICPPQG